MEEIMQGVDREVFRRWTSAEERRKQGWAELWCSLDRSLSWPYQEFWKWMSLQKCPELGWGGQAFVLASGSSVCYGLSQKGCLIWNEAASLARGNFQRGSQLRALRLQHPRQPKEWVPRFWRGVWTAHNTIHHTSKSAVEIIQSSQAWRAGP